MLTRPQRQLYLALAHEPENKQRVRILRVEGGRCVSMSQLEDVRQKLRLAANRVQQAERPHRNQIAEVAPDVNLHPIPRDKASTGPGYMRADGTLPFPWSGSDSRLRQASSDPAWKTPRSGAARSLQTEAVPMHKSIDRGRLMARSKRIDDVFDPPARHAQRATTHRSLWTMQLPPPGRRVGRWKSRGDGRDESADFGRFTDRSG